MGIVTAGIPRDLAQAEGVARDPSELASRILAVLNGRSTVASAFALGAVIGYLDALKRDGPGIDELMRVVRSTAEDQSRKLRAAAQH
jgi:hypothetical protein